MNHARLFLITFCISIFVGACQPDVSPNQAFVDTLTTHIGATNLEEIRANSYMYTDTIEYADWMQNVELGSFVNSRGEVVSVQTVNGDPAYTLKSERPVIRWVEPVGEVFETHCEGSSGTTNYVVVYGSGNAGTIGRLKINEATIQAFACEYFTLSYAPINVIHLNFHATQVPVQLVDIGNYGTTMPLQSFDWSTTSALSSNLRNQAGEVVRSEVILQLNNLQDSSDKVGLPTQQIIAMALTNELVGLVSGQQVSTQLYDHNQAYSTIAGLGAAFDTNTAKLFLGNYEGFVQLIAEEMMILTKIAIR